LELFRLILQAGFQVNEATERLQEMPKDGDRELTVLEKILARDPNPKTVMVMALDTMFAAVAMVSYVVCKKLMLLKSEVSTTVKIYMAVWWKTQCSLVGGYPQQDYKES
jgi:hypothetical protein